MRPHHHAGDVEANDCLPRRGCWPACRHQRCRKRHGSVQGATPTADALAHLEQPCPAAPPRSQQHLLYTAFLIQARHSYSKHVQVTEKLYSGE